MLHADCYLDFSPEVTGHCGSPQNTLAANLWVQFLLTRWYVTLSEVHQICFCSSFKMLAYFVQFQCVLISHDSKC